MKNAHDFLRLKAELTTGSSLLQSLLAKNRRATERASLLDEDEFAWAAVGYTIHNVYCLFENELSRIGTALDAHGRRTAPSTKQHVDDRIDHRTVDGHKTRVVPLLSFKHRQHGW